MSTPRGRAAGRRRSTSALADDAARRPANPRWDPGECLPTWSADGPAGRPRRAWTDPPDHRPRRARARASAQGNAGIYIGFDPTADSLHVGHLVGQLFLRRFQVAGHRPFPLAGGATGMVGDPGGRSEERNLLDLDTLRHNVECIKRQLSSLLDFEPGPFQATLVNNADWTEGISLLEFLRDVGKYATVNQMMAKDSVEGPAGERARHLVHRVQLLAAAGQRLPPPVRAPRRADPGGRVGPVGQHRRRRRPHPPPARRAGPSPSPIR